MPALISTPLEGMVSGVESHPSHVRVFPFLSPSFIRGSGWPQRHGTVCGQVQTRM